MVILFEQTPLEGDEDFSCMMSLRHRMALLNKSPCRETFAMLALGLAADLQSITTTPGTISKITEPLADSDRQALAGRLRGLAEMVEPHVVLSTRLQTEINKIVEGE